VVRDCVGYRSMGHGFSWKTVPRSTTSSTATSPCRRSKASAAEATAALRQERRLRFWWANSLNTFIRNTACECDEYGYFFQVIKSAAFDPVLAVPQPDGRRKKVDIRTLPFIRFDDNEAHCQRRHAFNLGGSAPFGPGVEGVGPDDRHPFVIRNFKVWNAHWAFHPVSPSVVVENLDIYNSEYGIWRPVYNHHAYRKVSLDLITVHKEFSPQGIAPKEADFPKPLDPVDDLPPATVITHFGKPAAGKVTVRGTTSDNGMVRRVLVNGPRSAGPGCQLRRVGSDPGAASVGRAETGGVRGRRRRQRGAAAPRCSV